MMVKVYHTQYRKLQRLFKKERDKAQANRYRIVICHYRCMKKTAISRYLGVARSTINRILMRFDEEGIDGLYDKRHEQGSRKVTDEYVETMLSLITDSPREHGWARSTWTRELLALHLKPERHGCQRTDFLSGKGAGPAIVWGFYFLPSM